jgi:hypothetical protein
VNANRILWTTLLTGGAAGVIREEFLRQAEPMPIGRVAEILDTVLVTPVIEAGKRKA